MPDFVWQKNIKSGDFLLARVERIYNPEGYFKDRGDFGDKGFNYFRRDHLGNNREVWHPQYSFNNISFAEKTIQRTQYYPSGLPWAESTGAGVQNKKYNGKEWIEMHGLDEYDSQARMYYPAIMRTTTLDPLAEKYYNISPYAWCGNNPVRNVDPDGMDWFYNDQTGAVAYVSNLHKGAEKGMKKGWQWMGGNGMFFKDNDDLSHTDLSLVNRYGGSEEYPFVINSQGKPERIISHVLELDGKDAENFMNDMGYNKEILEANVYSYDKKWSIPDTDGPQWQSNSYDKIEKVFSWTYVKEGSESNYNVLENYRRPIHIPSINGCSDTWERGERRRYSYTNSNNIDGSPVTKFFMMLLRYAVQIKYETPKRK